MQPPREFRDEHTPFGYLITFRGYGTWLHGKQGSIDRFHNTYGTPKLPADGARHRYNRSALVQPPVKLGARQRALVEEAIRETCEIRKWLCWTMNARTNHVHTVVTANCKPERVLAAFKANATRKLREAKCCASDRSPWAYRGSKRYLWTEKELLDAIAYVLYDQGEPLVAVEYRTASGSDRMLAYSWKGLGLSYGDVVFFRTADQSKQGELSLASGRYRSRFCNGSKSLESNLEFLNRDVNPTTRDTREVNQ